jgi:hypothetical protein
MMTTRLEAITAYKDALKAFEEVSQMYEAVRKNSTDPKMVPRLNQIAESLEQTRADLAIMQAKLDLMSGEVHHLYRKG